MGHHGIASAGDVGIIVVQDVRPDHHRQLGQRAFRAEQDLQWGVTGALLDWLMEVIRQRLDSQRENRESIRFHHKPGMFYGVGT